MQQSFLIHGFLFFTVSVHSGSLVTKTEVNACLEEKICSLEGFKLFSDVCVHNNLQLTQLRAWHISVNAQSRSI